MPILNKYYNVPLSDYQFYVGCIVVSQLWGLGSSVIGQSIGENQGQGDIQSRSHLKAPQVFFLCPASSNSWQSSLFVALILQR